MSNHKEEHRESKIIQARDQSEKVKQDLIEEMCKLYIRVDNLREHGSKVTVAEIVTKMPDQLVTAKAFKHSWTVDYMLSEFKEYMNKHGEIINNDVLGNLSRIESSGPAIIKI
jgi:hypothetical protein